MRGNHCRGVIWHRAIRSIPARAGEPRNPCSGHVTHTVYPPHCLKSNVTELRSHKASWQIRPRNARWLASVVGKTRRNASANLFWAFVMSALHLIDTRRGSPNCHYVNPSTRGSPRMPKERRARSLTVSAVSLTFKVDTARRQRMLRTESAQDGRTKIARAQPRIRDGERTSSTLTDATSPSPTPSATRHCRRPICRKQRPDQHQQGRRAFTLLVCCVCPVDRPIYGAGERGASFTCG